MTLLAKVYANSQLKPAKDLLKSTLKGLEFDIKVDGVTSRGWIQISISGEDEQVATRYLAQTIGFCPTNLENLQKFATAKGSIVTPNKSKKELYVDIGVYSPHTIDATIPLHHLQAQLTDGRKVALQKIAELYDLRENMPLTVKILKIDKENNYAEAMLAENQLIQYRKWTNSLLDRLIVLGASQHEIKTTLKVAGCNRDVVNVEPLGLFEYAVVCKLGTDAAGLIPKIGRNLQDAVFSIFNPRKIMEFAET